MGAECSRGHTVPVESTNPQEPEERPSLEALAREECLVLLASHSVGRVAAVEHDGLPLVVPVNYRVHEETILFRTDIGSKLDALKRHPIAFQIDEIDPVNRTGWSVLVQGIGHEIAPHDRELPDPDPWAGPRQHLIQIVPRSISGRRLRLPDVEHHPGGYL